MSCRLNASRVAIAQTRQPLLARQSPFEMQRRIRKRIILVVYTQLHRDSRDSSPTCETYSTFARRVLHIRCAIRLDSSYNQSVQWGWRV
jgi:hypothetical protein